MMIPALALPRDHYENDAKNAWITMMLTGVMAIVSCALIVAAIL